MRPYSALARLAGAFLLILCLGVAVASDALPRSSLTILGHKGTPLTFTVEVAANADDRRTGLMNRKSLAPDHGMIFIFPAPGPVMMWMKDTLIPLDMLFIDATGRIVNVAENARPMDETIISSRGTVSYVLELAGGTAKHLGIEGGDRVEGPALQFTAPD